MKKLFRDQRGSGSIELLVAVFILMFIFLAGFEPIVMTYNQQILEQAKMKGLDAMQTKGGLTSEIETGIIEYLEGRGFDPNEVKVMGTLAPVQWGDDISLEIQYKQTISSYRRTGLISLEKYDKELNYAAFGSTVSYFFDNN